MTAWENLTDEQRDAVEDYDSGASWQRVADAFERYGVDAVLADPSLVEPMPKVAR